MNKALKNYLPLAQAIESLLHPYAEVVIHDLGNGKIAALLNNFSKRKVGDNSLLGKEFPQEDIPDYFEPYYKTNWDGRKLKATTATLRDSEGKPIGLLCINLDISKWVEWADLISLFTNSVKGQPSVLFQEDIREKISVFVHEEIRQKGKTLKTLSKEDKQEIVLALKQQGAFKAKNAAAFVGDVLDVSRATVYKYLEGKMRLPLFKLEDYLAEWEFKAPYLLSLSDIESWSLKEILAMGDSETQALWSRLSLGYTEGQGMPLLREEIQKMYKSGQILTFAGAEEGIFATFQALLTPQDHVITFTPCYQSLETLPQHFGAEVTRIPLQESQNWQPDLAEFKAAIKPHTKLIILNFPHNPTGALIDKDTLHTIIELARKQGIYVFSDEVYRLLEIDESDRLPPLADCYERGISLSVMSKAFGMGGLRIGWIAMQDQKLFKEIANVKNYLSISNSCTSELLALIALRARDKILARNRKLMLSNLALLDVFFQKHQNLFSWVRPKGGCIAFPRLLAEKDYFTKDLLTKQGVLLLPGSIFNWKDSHFRIGFGRKNMPEALAQLDHFL